MEIFFSASMKKDPLSMFFSRRHTCGKILDMVTHFCHSLRAAMNYMRYVKNEKLCAEITFLMLEYLLIFLVIYYFGENFRMKYSINDEFIT